MASLERPFSCPICQDTVLIRKRSPERWECQQGHIALSRKNKPVTGICRVCTKSNKEVEFGKYGNICKKCKSEYHTQYRRDNDEILKQKHRDSYQRDKKKRQTAVRNSIQKSPEAFLRYLTLRCTRPSNPRFKKGHSKSPIDVCNINFQYLLEIYKSQNEKCAITGLKMSHKYHDLKTISVDRIDSSKGYVEGNIQLVCSCVNRLKNNHSNDSVVAFFNEFVEIACRGPVDKESWVSSYEEVVESGLRLKGEESETQAIE